jgi:hypothetical protein
MIERSSVKPLQFSAAARMRQFQAQSGPDGASVLLGRTRRVSLNEQGPPELAAFSARNFNGTRKRVSFVGADIKAGVACRSYGLFRNLAL